MLSRLPSDANSGNGSGKWRSSAKPIFRPDEQQTTETQKARTLTGFSCEFFPEAPIRVELMMADLQTGGVDLQACTASALTSSPPPVCTNAMPTASAAPLTALAAAIGTLSPADRAKLMQMLNAEP